MKAALVTAPSKIELISIAEPQIQKPTDVKIRVCYTSICVDELFPFRTAAVGDVMGHEFSGIITDLGEDAAEAGFSVGDHVTGYTWLFCGQCPSCRSGRENLCMNIKYSRGMQEYIVLESRQICKLPEGISLQLGCLSEIVAACVHGVDRARIRPGDSVLILGGGGTGMILLQLAKLCGASSVTVSEPLASKRELCRRLGAKYVLDPYAENIVAFGMQHTDGMGYQCIIDASRNEKAISEAFPLLSRGGTFLMFSLHEVMDNITIGLPALYTKEITLLTSYNAPYSLDRTMSILPLLNLEVLRSKPYPLERLQDAFEMACTSRLPRVFIEVTKE